MITYQDIVKRDAEPHPYSAYFNDEIIHRAQCIERQRKLAETFQKLTLDMQKEHQQQQQQKEEDPRLTKIKERLKKRLLLKKEQRKPLNNK